MNDVAQTTKEKLRLRHLLHMEEMILLYRELDAVNARLREEVLNELLGPAEIVDATEADITRTMKRNEVIRQRTPPQYDV